MPDHSDVRWRQRFQNFKKAFAQLAKGVSVAQQRELNEREQQGLIQASEFTHELAWNTLKDFLAASGSTDGNDRESQRHDAHFHEATAKEIAGAIIGRYTPELERFLYRLTQLEQREVNHGLSPKTLDEIKTALAHFPEVEKAVLYGSRAKGNYRRGSDIDLALLGTGLNHQLLARLGSALDDLVLPYRIDVSVFPQTRNTDLIEHIRHVGVPIYEKPRVASGR